MTTLLVTERDQVLRDTLADFLTREGYQIVVAGDGANALQLAREQSPDLILLQLNPGSTTSEQLCQCMQSESATPLLLLTAERMAQVDRSILSRTPGSAPGQVADSRLLRDDRDVRPSVGGQDDRHDAGACAASDLEAQLRAILRHTEPYPRMLTSGDLALDLLSRRAILGAQTLNLTPKEFHLLAEFVQHRGVLLSRAQLFDLVWGVNYAGDRRTLDVHISWLRKKIETYPKHPQRITTVRNLGYRFEN